MKNLLKLVLLVALFISTSSEVFSQTITNDTNCNFRGKIYFSYPSACDNSDDMNFFISATQFTILLHLSIANLELHFVEDLTMIL